MTLVMNDTAPAINHAPLIRVDRALESWRDSGHDLNTAAGEPVDNSVEAGARRIHVETFKVGTSNGRRNKESVDEIAFADDGSGIPLEILPSALTMGFSTRYGQRKGLGRFGVGAKLAALSQARRLDIYTKPAGSGEIYRAYFDLDEINGGQQEFITSEAVDAFPAKYAHLMRDEEGDEFSSGTLVVWSKVDRLEHQGSYGTAVDERIRDLTKYLGRTYRRFLASGLTVKLNGKPITPHDPLFLIPNSVAIELLGPKEWQADVIDTKKIAVGEHEAEVTVTLLPKKVRLQSGEGGSGGKGEPFKPLHIADNEGRVSILRNQREIFYEVVPRLLPGGVERIDRYIGIEVSFPAALDEYFQVRNVKKGAEPVDKLREDIRKFLKGAVTVARKRVRELWAETETADRQKTPAHTPAIQAYEKMEEAAPRGIAGCDVPAEEADRIREEAARDLGAETPDELAELKEQIRNQTITVVDGDWPGKELFEIDHLDGKVIMRLNWRHPFMREIYRPVKQVADGKGTDLGTAEIQELARRVESAVDLLLFTYAKAENQHPQPDRQYGQLRSYWGVFAAEAVRHLLNAGEA